MHKTLIIRTLLLVACLTSPLVVAAQDGRQGTAEKAGQVAAEAARALGSPLAKPLVDVANGFSRGLISPMVKQVQSSSEFSLVDIEVLAPLNMKTVREERCSAYIDLIRATQRGPGTKAERDANLKPVLARSWDARCLRYKTPLELMDPSLRAFYEPRRATLLPTPACTKYLGWADEIAFGNFPDAEKRVSLSQLFLAAQESRCTKG